ncbi:hypothetical protein PMAYCL1PPCAC_29480 [Pristionchus mayeri]|uniref:Uncharacterized protein n=1 Tax=Pristionchus mayeri TaxID=1317129 RepID=A0AAN5DAY5_9BILA|nr:hypothetical protein PMAYCL1PPCAC_29480 [Pristionchus mayeri]
MALAARLSTRTLGVSKRFASFQSIPTNAGKTPPTLEEFDPLNPGEWQLGAAGKILPRLPEGTKVGKLVMGKYGLYDPVLKKRVDTYSKALLDGKKSEEAGPFDRGVTTIAKVLGTCCFILGLYNLATLVNGKPLPPYTEHKAPGS